MAGPIETPYQGGVFNLELYLPEGAYPLDEGPRVRFKTRIFHPNIDRHGKSAIIRS